ncbi:MAG: uridine kinase [Glaciihabitans sp.]|nr:uridine kinase [Glaciihabitans sp.]
MAKWAPQRKDTVNALADEILHNYGRGRVIIAIDGLEGAGTAGFADDLAEAFEAKGHTAFRASLNDFQQRRSLRLARGADSAEGFYQDTFDYSVLRRVLIEPFRLGGSAAFVTAAFDASRDVQVEPKWVTGPDDALLIVDGLFLNRPELAGLWNYSLWLDVPTEDSERRVTEDTGDADRTAVHAAGQALYRAAVSPRRKATAIIDNTDSEHPRRQFADSC